MQIDTPKYILAMDCETSGLISGKDSINPAFDYRTGRRFQSLSWGMVVVDFDTFEPVETLEANIKFDASKFEWNTRAEAVHGLSQEFLAKNGIDEDEFAAQFAELVIKYWGISTPVICLGHNVYFDTFFLRDLLDRHEVPIRFSNRIIDTNTLAMTLDGITGSDAMFKRFGFEDRKTPSAIEDILMTLIAAKGYRDEFRASTRT